jgi:hypothetical protein
MSLKRQFLITVLLVFAASIFPGTVAHADDDAAYGVYDEAAYTQYVEDAMKKLDKLYLDFCDTCGTDTATASQSRQEFLVTVRDLMQYMNSRFDELEVSIHALTMLVDILTATQLEQMAAHPYNE